MKPQIPTMVSPETFRSYTVEGKLNTIFDYVYGIHLWQRDQCKNCEARLVSCTSKFDELDEKIEDTRRKRASMIAGYSGIGGVVGGAIIMGFKWAISLIVK